MNLFHWVYGIFSYKKYFLHIYMYVFVSKQMNFCELWSLESGLAENALFNVTMQKTIPEHLKVNH